MPPTQQHGVYRETKVTPRAACFPCTPYSYLSACWPSLSVSSSAVLAQKVQGCAQQQDRNCGQS